MKRKAAGRTTKKPAKKAAKDPNKPKRAPSAFFVFLYDLLSLIIVLSTLPIFFNHDSD